MIILCWNTICRLESKYVADMIIIPINWCIFSHFVVNLTSLISAVYIKSPLVSTEGMNHQLTCLCIVIISLLGTDSPTPQYEDILSPMNLPPFPSLSSLATSQLESPVIVFCHSLSLPSWLMIKMYVAFPRRSIDCREMLFMYEWTDADKSTFPLAD